MTQWRTIRNDIVLMPLTLRQSLYDEFALAHSRWSAVTLHAISDVFVNLTTQKKASEKRKMHKQSVSRAVGVFQVFLKGKKIIKK
jgi:hypothetical protein